MGNPARKPHEKEGSRGRILDGATEEFAAAGFAGARIDQAADHPETRRGAADAWDGLEHAAVA